METAPVASVVWLSLSFLALAPLRVQAAQGEAIGLSPGGYGIVTTVLETPHFKIMDSRRMDFSPDFFREQSFPLNI